MNRGMELLGVVLPHLLCEISGRLLVNFVGFSLLPLKISDSFDQIVVNFSQILVSVGQSILGSFTPF